MHWHCVVRLLFVQFVTKHGPHIFKIISQQRSDLGRKHLYIWMQEELCFCVSLWQLLQALKTKARLQFKEFLFHFWKIVTKTIFSETPFSKPVTVIMCHEECWLQKYTNLENGNEAERVNNIPLITQLFTPWRERSHTSVQSSIRQTNAGDKDSRGKMTLSCLLPPW